MSDGLIHPSLSDLPGAKLTRRIYLRGYIPEIPPVDAPDDVLIAFAKAVADPSLARDYVTRFHPPTPSARQDAEDRDGCVMFVAVHVKNVGMSLHPIADWAVPPELVEEYKKLKAGIRL